MGLGEAGDEEDHEAEELRHHEPQAALLRRYEERNGASQCRYGCQHCADSCPRGVAIADVLRSRMYDRDYGDPELGRQEYARLGPGAEACLSCADPSCACPFGLPIDRLTAATHRRLG